MNELVRMCQISFGFEARMPIFGFVGCTRRPHSPIEAVENSSLGVQNVVADSSARMMKALVGQLGAHEALYPVDGKGKELRPVVP